MANFVYREISKFTQSSFSCPILPGEYKIQNVKVFNDDIPTQLTKENVKLEINGSHFGNDLELIKLFSAVIFLIDQ